MFFFVSFSLLFFSFLLFWKIYHENNDSQFTKIYWIDLGWRKLLYWKPKQIALSDVNVSDSRCIWRIAIAAHYIYNKALYIWCDEMLFPYDGCYANCCNSLGSCLCIARLAIFIGCLCGAFSFSVFVFPIWNCDLYIYILFFSCSLSFTISM